MRKHLLFEKLIPNGVAIHTFKTKDEFYAYVRRMDYTNYCKKRSNYFLEAVMCNPNDTQRHHKYFVRRYPFYNTETAGYDCYYVGYLTKDSKNRIIDLRDYVTELYAFDLEAYKSKMNSQRCMKFATLQEVRNTEWDKDNKLREGKHYWTTYYRRIQTTQERRYSQDLDHKPFVRGRRSFARLPNAWDDLYFHREKNWKARDKKARRNWEVNLSKHIDTVSLPSKWEEEYLEEYFEG